MLNLIVRDLDPALREVGKGRGHHQRDEWQRNDDHTLGSQGTVRPGQVEQSPAPPIHVWGIGLASWA